MGGHASTRRNEERVREKHGEKIIQHKKDRGNIRKVG